MRSLNDTDSEAGQNMLVTTTSITTYGRKIGDYPKTATILVILKTKIKV